MNENENTNHLNNTEKAPETTTPAEAEKKRGRSGKQRPTAAGFQKTAGTGSK